MSLRERVVVEDLEPEAWRHLEQRVVARVGDAVATPTPRRWWPALAAVAAAAAVVVAIVATRGTTAPARPMVVAADGRGAHVDLGDAVIDAEPGTRSEGTRPDGGVRIALATGAIALEVAPRRGRPPLWVVADDVTVRVIGTAFTVRRAPAIEVAVSHGVVQVERGGALVAVRAGERWSTADGVVAVARAANAGAGTGAGVGPAGTIGATTPGAGLTTGPGVAFDPLAEAHVAAAPPTSPTAPPPPAVATGHDHPRPGRPRPPTPPADAATDLRRALAAQPVAAAPPTTATTAAAAIAEFQRASVTSRGAAAASAQWGLARTQWSSGRARDALRSLDGYLRRFPTGAESDAVHWLRLRLLCARSFDDTCRAAAHTYADRTTDPTRRALALRVTDTR
ncbi:MAG: FecR domain-containing protein [Myxococcales bacterium]|nr:FecR domain-containing protein [Myxococcales bacterium]